jgi:hypothetical protein
MRRRLPQRVIHHNDLPVRDRLYRVRRIGRNDSDMAGAYLLGSAADGQFQPPFDHFVNFFLGMKMLMD